VSKLVVLDRRYWPQGGYGHWCPGCNCGHEINVDEVNSSGAKWTFNNNRYKPTFSPSINIRIGRPGAKTVEPAAEICHYFIKDGQIQFLNDCTHSLRGQTVDMPEMPDNRYHTSPRL
jgi:hypothetical protein